MGAVAQGAAEDALHLLGAQLKLVRLEVTADVRRGLQGAVRVAFLLPPLVLGYAFAMAALVSWLGVHWGRPPALAAVAALQLVPASIGVVHTLRVLRRSRDPVPAGPEMADGFRRTLVAVPAAPRP